MVDLSQQGGYKIRRAGGYLEQTSRKLCDHGLKELAA